jgi:MFS family permease
MAEANSAEPDSSPVRSENTAQKPAGDVGQTASRIESINETALREEPEPNAKPKGGTAYIPSGWPMLVLGLVIAVDQLDQNILRGVLSQLKQAFDLSDWALGWLTSAFVIVHAVVTVPAGYIADRRIRRKTIGWTVIFWSILTSLTAVSQTYWMLFAFRALLGVGQGITEPSASSLIADYYPPSKRGTAFSVQQNLFFVGAGLGLAMGGFVGEHFGWRWAFLLAGLPGLAVATLAYRLKEPRRGFGDRLAVGAAKSFEPADESEVRPLFEEGVGRFFALLLRGLYHDMRTIASIPTLRYSLVGVSVLLFTVTGLSAWLPIFYQRYSAMSESRSALIVGAMVTFGGIAGTLVGGAIADRYAMKIKGGRVVIPAYCIFLAAAAMALSLPRLLDHGVMLWFRIIFQLGAIFFVTMAIPALRAGLSDAVPATLRGAGFAAFSLVAAISGSALAAPLLGVLADAMNTERVVDTLAKIVREGWVADKLGVGIPGAGLRLAFWIILPPVVFGSWVLYKARNHMDRDAARILMAVMEAMQKQKEEEAAAKAEKALSG